VGLEEGQPFDKLKVNRKMGLIDSRVR